MVKKLLIQLTDKFLCNSISDNELLQLESLLKDSENERLFKEIVKDSYLLKSENISFNVLKAYKQSQKKVIQSSKKKPFMLKNYYKIVAIFIIALSIGFIAKQLLIPLTNNTIQVSNNFIELELEDGSIHLIKTEDKDTLKSVKNSVLGLIDKGSISYVSQKQEANYEYHTLKVPYGKQFDITLSDGSLIHLNSGSSMRYPITFNKTGSRNVFLTGEAFFDVSRDENSPFIVNTNDINIEVLGTQFNVSAYNEDDIVSTTLQEGAVKVYNNSNPENTMLLTPNEQSVWDKSNMTLNKKVVNTSLYTSWMDGILIFKETPFKDIIKKLQRHFDIDIKTTNKKLLNEKFTARFDIETIEQIMLYFKISNNVNYTINKRTIIIE